MQKHYVKRGDFMRKFLALVLVLILVLSMAGCKSSAPTSITGVNLKMVKNQEMGSMMPKMLFVHDNKVAFWGEFGLYIINGEDGSIYRSVNLGNVGFNHMTGELKTIFTFSPDFDKIFFYNEDASDKNVEDFYYVYMIEEDIIKQIPNDVAFEHFEDQPVFSLHDLGGGDPEKGYASNPLFYDGITGCYLYSETWRVKDLKFVKYNIQTEETTMIKIFD